MANWLPKNGIGYVPGKGTSYVNSSTGFGPQPLAPKPAPTAAPSGSADKGGTRAPSPDAPQSPAPNTSWQDSAYNNTISGINANLGNLSDYLLNKGNSLGLDYGVSFDRDPNNPLTGSNFHIDQNVDVTNPFSRAALLQRHYQQAQSGNTNSYAAQGQLYSGALQNAQNQAGFQNLQGQDALLKGFSGEFGDLYGQFLNAQTQGNQQGIDAQGAALGRHESDPAGPEIPPGVPLSMAPPPPPGVVPGPGVIYLPNDGQTPAQIVQADGTVRPATPDDKGGTRA